MTSTWRKVGIYQIVQIWFNKDYGHIVKIIHAWHHWFFFGITGRWVTLYLGQVIRDLYFCLVHSSLGTYANAKIGIVHTMGRVGGEVSNQWHVELPERGYIVVVA